MCILFIYTNGKASANEYKLILVSNRDEHYARPAASVAEWNGYKNVFGGVDMEPGREGGTWLAIGGNDNIIKVGALLNIGGQPKCKARQGRGPIVAEYVTGNLSNEDYCAKLIEHHDYYSSFNLVTVEIKDELAQVMHCCNDPVDSRTWPECTPLGFGNSPTDCELEKVKHGKDLFAKIVSSYQNDKNNLVEKCMELLKNNTKHWPDNELIKREPELGELLSSIYVEILKSGYGSRTRSVILVDWKNRMDFYEETMTTNDPKGEWEKNHIFRQL